MNKKPPEVFELPATDRILVLGDIHGDFEKLVTMLVKLKIVDMNFNWIAGETVVVQLGDQIDSLRYHPNFVDNNYSDLKVIFLFDILAKKAEIHGGKVYSLLGNHEIMNVENNFSYVAPSGFTEFEDLCKGKNSMMCMSRNGKTIRKKAFEKGGFLAKKFANERYSILKIGSNIFCHGDVVLELANSYNISEINLNIRKWLLGKNVQPNFKKFINDADKSHFWSRRYSSLQANLPDSSMCDGLDDVLKIYNAKSLIVGHTPQSTGINSTCARKVWRADIGFSRSFSLFNPEFQKIEALEIINDTNFNVIKR